MSTQALEPPSHFESYTQTRKNLRHVFDSAHAGRVTTVQRDHERFAVLNAGQLVDTLMRLRPAGAVVLAEGGGWAALMPGLPVHGDGESLDDAVDDLIDALREYAEDWNTRLRNAPNHSENLAVVTIARLADDNQLRAWLLAGGPSDPGPPASPDLTGR